MCCIYSQYSIFNYAIVSLWNIITYLLLGLLSPPIRTSLDGLVAEAAKFSGLASILILLGKEDGGSFLDDVGWDWVGCLNSNSSSVTYPPASFTGRKRRDWLKN